MKTKHDYQLEITMYLFKQPVHVSLFRCVINPRDSVLGDMWSVIDSDGNNCLINGFFTNMKLELIANKAYFFLCIYIMYYI